MSRVQTVTVSGFAILVLVFLRSWLVPLSPDIFSAGMLNIMAKS